MGKMLIVDDLELNRRILKSLFGKEYDVLEAQNGKETLLAMDAYKDEIEIVLLDLILEDMTGFDILEEGRKRGFFPNVPVIVITGSGQNDDQVRAFELGANDFIVTPLVPEIVLSRVENVVSANRRIQSVEKEAKKLKIKSEVDEMTGLLNKSITEDAIDRVLRKKKNNSSDAVMLVVDIDHFKTVNDTLGHQMGDHVIRIIADLLSSQFDSNDIVGRIGGDEFCVFMQDVKDMELVYQKLNEMLLLMEHKPNIDVPKYVTLSIGLAAKQEDDDNYASLFKKADKALYKAKQAGKAQYYEYGIAKTEEKKKKKIPALLISQERSMISGIQAHIPKNVALQSVMDFEKLTEWEIAEDALILVDVSAYDDNASKCWKRISQIKGISFENVYAICQEGNRDQYLEALNTGVADLFTAPLDYKSFQRRMRKRIKQNPKE